LLIDYHIHAIGHDDREQNMENLLEFVKEAEKKGITEIGFADHDRYLNKLDLNIYNQLQEKSPKVRIKTGLEIDYFPNKLMQIKKYATYYDYDYLIGSVHYIDDWMFDSDKETAIYAKWDNDEMYAAYLHLVEGAVNLGYFSFIGHLDLIKIFGYRPQKRSISETFNDVLGIINKSGIAIEINTNGLYKPVNEIYPSEDILKLSFEKNIPITLSSDAHQAADVGRDIAYAAEIAKKIGYRKIAVFNKMKMSYENI